MYDTLCSDLFLYNFETCQNLPYKINLPGYEFPLVHVHPYTLELSFGHFQALKDQVYQKSKILTLPKRQKYPLLDQKNPFCIGETPF